MCCSLGSHGTSHGTALSEDEQAWRNWPLARREREYSPSSCIASSTPFLAAYAARSRDAELRLRGQKNLRWGETADETFDFFAAGSPDAPLLLFIHGGYWQELSKNESLFAAPDCVANGIAYAALDYTLAPHASLETIVKQCRRAVAYFHREAGALGFNRRRIFVAGSSAGAHLAAMLLAGGWLEQFGLPEDAVAGAVLLSGIYDIEPLIGTYIDAALHLTSADAESLSPMRLPLGRSVPAVVACGEHETAEFKRQSRAYAARLAAAGFPVSVLEVAGANHFDIVFGLADRASALGRATLEMIEGGKPASPEGPRGTSGQT
jgi:arylformamidase